MKAIILTPWLSPHKLPLAKAISRYLQGDQFRFIYLNPPAQHHIVWGWDKLGNEEWCHLGSITDDSLKECDVLLTSIRNWDLVEERMQRSLVSVYNFERWFKPPLGMMRLLSPRYFLMARRFVRLLRRGDQLLQCLPIGIYAARDMARLVGLFSGDVRCLFRAPELEFERKPCGRIWLAQRHRGASDERRYCLDKMRMWGYFVESSKTPNPQLSTHNSLRVLWVGRLLKLKRVDTIIKAVGELSREQKVTLDIYGTGPEEAKLKKLAAQYGGAIKFSPPVRINEVRRIMREHDIYVLASNAYEGWGAVVSEALEEGMKVIGTYESGSSATILPASFLFHSGDWRRLIMLLRNVENMESLPRGEFFKWSAEVAAKRLIGEFING